MSKSIETRLRDIEAKLSPAAFRTCHRIIADTADECEAMTAALMADGRASPSDRFIHRVMVTP
jgi:hypothetical protein